MTGRIILGSGSTPSVVPAVPPSSGATNGAPTQPRAPASRKPILRGVSPITARLTGRGAVGAAHNGGGDSDSGGAAHAPPLVVGAVPEVSGSAAALAPTTAAAAAATASAPSVPALRLLHGVLPPVLDMFGRTRASPMLFSGDQVGAPLFGGQFEGVPCPSGQYVCIETYILAWRLCV